MKRIDTLFLLLGLAVALLVGCTSSATPLAPTHAGTDEATEESNRTESATATEAPAPTATLAATEEATGDASAMVVRIKNEALGTYLAEVDGAVQLAESGGTWAIEDYQGSKRIYNTETDNYIAIEHLLDHVEAIAIEPVWMSPRWTFEGDPSAGPITIRNVWHNWEVLYADAESGALMYGRPPADPTASKWVIETLEGGSVAAPTPTAVVALTTPTGPLADRGALVPWQEYEAEAGRTNGQKLGPDRLFGTIASESSGRQAVELIQAGQYVEFTATEAANSIVVRYAIPDAEEGGGIEATISLYVNGTFRQKLNLTSKYAWSYGGAAATFNQPAALGSHKFYDEARALTEEIPAGATVRLQMDADDTAEYYVIDLVDLEAVAEPKSQPEGYLSLTDDCGATPDDGDDDGEALQQCLDDAREAGTGVYAPPGTYDLTEAPIDVQNVTLQGAGMWYTVFNGFYARFNCQGDGCRYFDFAILGDTVARDDASPENGFNNGAGYGSVLDGIWVEHTKVGYWVGPGLTNGLIIRNSRFRNLFADGVNFSNGTSNSIIENSHFRYTGDDSMASWSQEGESRINTNNVFRFNTVQLPWRANCIAIYGGTDNKIEDNLCYDVLTYPGILISQAFASKPFDGTTSVTRNSLIRAGGMWERQEWGAFKIRGLQGPIKNIVVTDLVIEDSTFAGIELEGAGDLTGIVFDGVQITGAGRSGILIRSNVTGDATFSNVVVSNSGQEALTNNAPSALFDLIREIGNVGW